MGIELEGPQITVLDALDSDITIALPWGRGVGKSWLLRLIGYLMVARYDGWTRPGAQYPGVRIIWLMDTLKHFKDVHAKLLVAELEGQWAFLGAKINRGTWDIDFPGGSWMKPYPALEHTARSARGARCDVVLADECDDTPKSVFHAVAVPWFTEPWSLKIRAVGGTPRKGRYGLLNELHELGKSTDPEDDEYKTCFATYKDVPRIVDRKVVEKARRTTPKGIFSREWDCSFDSPEGLVYDLFDDAVHVRPCPSTHFSKILVGVDWGYVDPGVFLVLGLTGHGEDSQAWVLEEHYETGKVLAWWTDKAREVELAYPGGSWFADPSDPSSTETLRRDAKVKIQKADNRIHPGVRCVASLMCVYGEGEKRWTRLFVDPRCKNMIRELQTYRRKPDPKDADSYLEEIEGKNDHAADALRYALMGQFSHLACERHEISETVYG